MDQDKSIKEIENWKKIKVSPLINQRIGQIQ